ncbi:MAG: T9SS type A sorting domain-containing protein [Candidatus Zixiibacteriota bacterium]
MKNFALTSILLILLVGGLWGQNDPIGETDTVSVVPITISPGQEFGLKINLWNDEELGAITLPFYYPTDKLEFLSVDFTGYRIEYIKTKPVTHHADVGTILIGAVVITESFLQPGSGTLCEIRFKASAELTADEIFRVDTGFIAPSNSLLLTDNTGTRNFLPAFTNADITVGMENRAPYFTPIPDVYVAEGESLYIDVQVTDPDGDDVSIVNPIHPYNSDFVDNGDGTGLFAWRPDFIGPLSADMSPFYFVFWTTDGDASSYYRVRVNVINVNRAPIINAPASVQNEAGDSIGIHVSAFDPDFEPVTWEISGLPNGATFDGENPGLISWNSDFSDSGHYEITLIATDPFGLTDTATIDIELLPVTLFSLTIDTLTSFSGRIVDIDVSLKNKLNVKEFSLLLFYDPTALSLQYVSNSGSRSEGFSSFTYQNNANGSPGLLRIDGVAGGADPLGEGEGTLFTLTFQISTNLNYIGQQVPISFKTLFTSDNVLVLDDNTTIYAYEMNLFGGYILIGASGERLLGDINLNGIAYEISDAVYFSNYYVSPESYPLNDQQILNADINMDGTAPTIADLIMLIKIITGEQNPITYKQGEIQAMGASSVQATAELVREDDGLFIMFDCPVDIGGALVRLSGEDVGQLNAINLTTMDMMSAVKNTTASYLLLSYAGELIGSGEMTAMQISDDPSLEIELAEVELADVNGAVIETNKVGSGVLPEQFELFQNFPNPFNPTTEIKFNLSAPAHVDLTVYNILGQEVIRLVNGEYPAGQHSITWNSTDRFGDAVASGIYLYRIKAGDTVASRKMVLLK